MSDFRYAPFATLLAAMLLLAACDQADPYAREGMWRPEGVAAANLAAQVANPADLRRGRSDNTPNYRTSTAAVNKLWAIPASPAGGAPANPAAALLLPTAGLFGAAGGAPAAPPQ